MLKSLKQTGCLVSVVASSLTLTLSQRERGLPGGEGTSGRRGNSLEERSFKKDHRDRFSRHADYTSCLSIRKIYNSYCFDN
jgi:hypothetical protein